MKEELQGPGSLLGYRSMWSRLKSKYNLSVTRYIIIVDTELLDDQIQFVL